MKQFEMFELTLNGPVLQENRAVIDLKAVFTLRASDKSEKSVTVPGFYDGDGIYRIRFYPRDAGFYSWKISGLIEEKGWEECLPAYNGCTGIIRADGSFFRYDGGSYFIPVGTTVYAIAHQEKELIECTLSTLQKAPFNKVRLCVFPKSYDYNQNEPDYYPFEKNTDGSWNVNNPCLEFWHHFEGIILQLAQMNIQTDLILFHPYDRWGFSTLTMEENHTYLHYLISRLAAIPSIWWSMANEYDLLFARTLEDWYSIEEQIAEEDIYGHLLSNHNCILPYDFARDNISHCSLQIREPWKLRRFAEDYHKPVIYDEMAYEGNLQFDWGNIDGFDMANRFWEVMTQGGYGTHGEVILTDEILDNWDERENAVLWWAKGGVMHGESPERIAYLKDFMQIWLKKYGRPVEYWDTEAYHDTERSVPSGENINPDSPLLAMMKKDREEGIDREPAYIEPKYGGRIEEKMFLRYFGNCRPCICTLYLPRNRQYRISIINIWDMSQSYLKGFFSGEVSLRLPGKKGIAVLAEE